jgi:hypothetical protein
MAVSTQRLREAVLHWEARVLGCQAPDCSRHHRIWKRISSHSRSIRVHGVQYCFPQCFERELQRKCEALQLSEGFESRRERRIPLGLLMLSRDDVTPAQLHEALAEQGRRNEMRIGECMQRLGFVGQQQVTAALAAQWRCPVLHKMPRQLLHCGLPHGLLLEFEMLPVHFVSATRTVHVAFATEIAYGALVAVEQMLDCRTEACLVTPAAFQAGIERLQQTAAPSEKLFANSRSPAEIARITSSYAARLEAENVKLVACGDLAWVRIDGDREPTNLLFQRPC